MLKGKQKCSVETVFQGFLCFLCKIKMNIMAFDNTRQLTTLQKEILFKILKARFAGNMNRHAHLNWADVHTKLNSPSSEEKLWSLQEMERTGGEPDVTGYDPPTGEYIFCDCSPESPKGRRSLCYDREALEARKEFKPENSAIDLATAMGINLLSEEQYRDLQQIGIFDAKTSSWVKTPDEIRKLGGSLFCDRRYNHVFLYHNGAESYYGVRGFRGMLKI
jgi:hypothetical protein